VCVLYPSSGKSSLLPHFSVLTSARPLLAPLQMQTACIVYVPGHSQQLPVSSMADIMTLGVCRCCCMVSVYGPQYTEAGVPHVTALYPCQSTCGTIYHLHSTFPWGWYLGQHSGQSWPGTSFCCLIRRTLSVLMCGEALCSASVYSWAGLKR
jgi:hypothetical protein